MICGVEVPGGVFVFRIVTAANVAANQTDAQVYPAVAGFQAVRAAGCAGGDGLDLIQVGTLIG
jgi:hypothetical protein